MHLPKDCRQQRTGSTNLKTDQLTFYPKNREKQKEIKTVCDPWYNIKRCNLDGTEILEGKWGEKNLKKQWPKSPPQI